MIFSKYTYKCWKLVSSSSSINKTLKVFSQVKISNLLMVLVMKNHHINSTHNCLFMFRTCWKNKINRQATATTKSSSLFSMNIFANYKHSERNWNVHCYFAVVGFKIGNYIKEIVHFQPFYRKSLSEYLDRYLRR